MSAIGRSRAGRGSRSGNWRRRDWDRFWQIVEDKLTTAEAELALSQAADIAGEAPACLLCYEADWRGCHRRRVAEILAARHGFAVDHLSVMEIGA